MDKSQRKITQQIHSIARNRLGFDQLYPDQEKVLHHVLAGCDTLAVMPTGSGKSAIYQIAALQLTGPTVVVSPLIALQKDQVDAINSFNTVGEATAVNSTLSVAERADTLEEIQEQDVEFVFLAPEQFQDSEVLEELKQAKPSLFVVDEAHCISEWGHDFRPDYLRLRGVVEALDHPVVLALTATAAPTVRAEIVDRLAMHDPAVVVSGFDRPNIWLGACIFSDEASKQRAILVEVEAAEKPGLIYVATRKHAEQMAADLLKRKVKTAFYHAGMKRAERERIHNQFLADDLEVVVATTAFGMGIDKPNVHFVFHYDIPGSLDSYYQQIGRAGRDDHSARALLFYRPEDLSLQHFFAGSSGHEADQVEQVLHVIQQHGEPIEINVLREMVDFSQTQLTSVLTRLECIGAVEIQPDGRVATTVMPDKPADAAVAVTEAQERHQRLQQSRVEVMRGYAEVHDCRRKYLLNYFGEEFASPCNHCDNCQAGEVLENQAQPFPLNSRVAHNRWGEGVVMHCEGDKVTVLFDELGYKTLALDVVLQNQLLRPLP